MGRKIIVLEAVYDNSDIMTDYFDRDHGYLEHFVAPLEGKVVTEAKLRQALRKLPQWLQGYEWKFRKGEKYSMSDHPHGQLRADNGVGITVKNQEGRQDCGLGFILGISYESVFTMNHSMTTPIPATREEFLTQVAGKEKIQEEKRQAMRKKFEEAQTKIQSKFQPPATISEPKTLVNYIV